MNLSGDLLLHGTGVRGSGAPFAARDPQTGRELPGSFASAGERDTAHAVRFAAAAAAAFATAGRPRRAALLRGIAAAIDALGDELLARCRQETALPLPRLQNERARTLNQLRLFADLIEDGACFEPRIEPADPTRQPPKPDLRSLLVPLGPVAVFGASNFPLAFSVAGGDTASALAAGCPVVVKAHPAHPGTSELVGRAVQRAVAEAGLPPGCFGMLHGDGHDVGQWLVAAAGIRACGFTGSFAGGRALLAAAAARPVPIPVFAEMGSCNPVVLFAGALAERAAALAQQLGDSALLACGQFCTSPGLLLLPAGAAGDAFVAALLQRFHGAAAAPMVHAGVAAGFRRGLGELRIESGVELLCEAAAAGVDTFAAPVLLQTTVPVLLRSERLRRELYGPGLLLVRFANGGELRAAVAALDGQLTGTVHGTAAELEGQREVIELLAERVGRLLFGGVPTGVEVSPAMQHGGPWPASSDARFTSVGTGAIRRWLRPLCFQDAPAELLPAELRDPPAPMPAAGP